MTEAATATARREELLARLTSWLDEALAEEAPPAGLAAELLSGPQVDERECDLFALWSAMTTLAQEVKLQGRTFHALEQAVRPLPDGVSALREANERVLQDRRRLEEERAAAASLDVLLDVRERLRRGVTDARAHVDGLRRATPPGRLARLLGVAGPAASTGEAERAFVRGYELALERLDDALRERGVVELACAGKAFDPHRMRAVDLAPPARGEAEGTVLEVLRAGYERRGELLRAAEVRVARGGVT